MNDDLEPNVMLPELPAQTAITPSHGKGLIKPFNKNDPAARERARLAGQKGAAVAHAKRKASGIKTKTQVRDEARIRAAQARTLRDLGIKMALTDKDAIAAPDLVIRLAKTVLSDVLGRMAGGDPDLAPRNLKEAADAARIMQNIIRAEEGKPAIPDEGKPAPGAGEGAATSIVDFKKRMLAAKAAKAGEGA